jgi:uncharacterized protein (DUF169 family)
MEEHYRDKLGALLTALGLPEEPMGVYYTDTEPAGGISPISQRPISRQAEQKGEIDWKTVFDNFTCVLSIVWRARQKHTAAYFDRERFGCPGAAFYLGFMKPYLIIHPDFISVSEHYVESRDAAQEFFERIDPCLAPARFCVVKPISLFQGDERPLVVIFFARAEVLSGLYSLAAFLYRGTDVVLTPFGPGCAGIVTWPIKFIAEGKERAVIGGFDPSCRKFLKTDELTFSVPFSMYTKMLDRFSDSFLTQEIWKTTKKKIEISRKAWGETD